MMVSYASIIARAIEETPLNQLIIAAELYAKLSSKITEAAFYKTMERFVKNETLIHLTRGVYYRPKKTQFGIVPISDHRIAEHYLKNQQGILIGYQMYNQKGITTQIGKQIEVLSTILPEERKHINNVVVHRITIPLTAEIIAAIQALEILQAYREIEELNMKALTAHMTHFAQGYSAAAMEIVLAHRKYKKSTIALMAALLHYHGVEHGLNKYLSPMSDYKIPNVEEWYAFT